MSTAHLPDLTAVGQTWRDGRAALYEMAWTDVEGATTEAAAVLRSFGLQRDDHILFIATTGEYLQVLPWQRAAELSGAVYSCADSADWDAARSAMFLTQFRSRVVVGLSAAVAEALAAREDARELFRIPAGLLVRPQAGPVLDRLGVEHRRWEPVGPGVLAACRGGTGAHLIPSHLDAREVGGGVEVSDGATSWVVPGAVGVEKAPCGCGSTADRVVIP